MNKKSINNRIPVWIWGVVLIVLVISGVLIGQIFPSTKPSAESCDSCGCPGDTQTRPVDGMIMAYVPAGEFLMGSKDESPIHRVVLDGYWIDQTEVTNAQYVKFLNQIVESLEIVDNEIVYYEDNRIYDLICDNCPADNRITWDGTQFDALPEYGEHPVFMVSWYGAQAYCTWVGGQLPTEAQWEYAARGPEGNLYPWGNTADCSRGNFDDETLWDRYVVEGGESCDGYVSTAPVGSFPEGVSWVGALDMAGNVWEWVADWWGKYSRWQQVNPTGPEEGEARVRRGGGYSDDWVVPATERSTFHPENITNVDGFRCVFEQSEQIP